MAPPTGVSRLELWASVAWSDAVPQRRPNPPLIPGVSMSPAEQRPKNGDGYHPTGALRDSTALEFGRGTGDAKVCIPVSAHVRLVWQ